MKINIIQYKTSKRTHTKSEVMLLLAEKTRNSSLQCTLNNSLNTTCWRVLTLLEQWLIFQNVFYWKQFHFNSENIEWQFYRPPVYTLNPSSAFHFIFSSQTIFACQVLTIFSLSKIFPDLLFVTQVAKFLKLYRLNHCLFSSQPTFILFLLKQT